MKTKGEPTQRQDRESRETPGIRRGASISWGQGPAKVSSGLCSFLYETRILEFLRLAVWFFSRLILVASRARASLYTKPSGLTLDPAARATWGSWGPRLLPFLRYIPWMLTLNRTAMPGAAYPKLSNRRARRLVFTWEAAALVSRPFLSLLIREKRREATGGHAYNDHTPGARSPGPAPLVEGRWCVSWGCHNKETLRGRETTSHEATKHSCQDIIRKWPRLASL